MTGLPETWSVPVVRADFDHDRAWQWIVREIGAATEEGFGGDVEFVEDRTLAGLDGLAIAARYLPAYPCEYRHPVLFVADLVAMAAPEHALLVVNLNTGVDAGPFRTVPRQVQAIQNNLSLANMDYVDFERAAGPDGVFRGF
ncbi:hypothetical protein AB0M79_09300 [Polymorphospora sp. NPDC051019]|uniref:DUF6924 domain-containing protein n=1 Tax=Polymorphospora sp. NPDC051019 TaxID=3155725 RepID=UPI003436DA30